MASPGGNTVQRTIGDIRDLMRKAQQAGEDAQKERARLRANPDGTRGDLSAGDYEKQIGEKAQAQIAGFRRAMGERFVGLGSDLRSMKGRARTFADERGAADAWREKVRPMLDAGATIDQVVAFAVAHDDGDMLAALHGHAPSFMAARHGGDPNDKQIAMAVGEALLKIEQAQEKGGFIDSETLEYRALAREATGLADEADVVFSLAQTQASRDLNGTDLLKTGYAVNAAKQVAAGEQPAEPA